MGERPMSWRPFCGRRAIGRKALLMALVLVLAAGNAEAQSAKDRELLLKAAFLHNFAKFVEWPPEAFTSPSSPLTVCVRSDDAFAVMAQAMNGKTVGERPLSVIDSRQSAAPASCHITFISADELESSYAAHLKKPYSLTVSDRERFARTGGMVGLVIVENKIRFEVNLLATRAARLRIQPGLLRLAADVIE